jgi:hypothetical protein
VFQELFLARDVRFMCGPDEFNLDRFDWACGLMRTVTRTPNLVDPYTMYRLGSSPLDKISQRIHHEFHEGDPQSIFILSDSLLATNPRDYVYGLLGVINLHIEPDYTLSTQDVFIGLASTWITQYSNLETLRLAGIAMKKASIIISGLPSWVTDWVALTTGSQSLLGLGDAQVSSNLPVKFRISTDRTTLWAQGIVCDNIISLLPKMVEDEEEDFGEAFRVNLWSMILHPDGISHPTGMSRFQAAFSLTLHTALAYTKLHDVDSNLKLYVIHFLFLLATAEKYYEYIAEFEIDISIQNQMEAMRTELSPLEHHSLLFLRMSVLSIHFRGFLSMDDICKEDLESFLSETHPICVNNMNIRSFEKNRNHTPFHTASGYVGMAPYCVMPGDLVCVLYGFKSPIILRRESNRYIVVSECIVVGLMEGEIIAAVDTGGILSQEFKIC